MDEVIKVYGQPSGDEVSGGVQQRVGSGPVRGKRRVRRGQAVKQEREGWAVGPLGVTKSGAVEGGGCERDNVCRVLDELADGCAACWVTRQGEDDEDWFLHSPADCRVGPSELSVDGCDNFRRRLRYAKDSHTCFKCGISQKLCNSRKGSKEKCQRTGVAMPILIAAMGAGQEGQAILERCGFRRGSDDLSGYQKWLGLRHQRQIWGENVSNSMAVLLSVILHTKG
jgi:hypothetical protein